jgi:serine/threonine protein kinase
LLYLLRDRTVMAGFGSIGSFQVTGTLGQGAHSSILQVRRAADSRTYALKVVPIDGADDQKFLEQAQHEFRVAQMLDHPNLIKVHALELNRDWLFRVRKVHLLIEFVNGKTLDTFPRLVLPRLVQIFEKIAAGLVHMHRRGVYHADLKPNNVMLSKTGQVKVIDYGLAWVKGEVKDRVQGTPEYMAPEQGKHKSVNERSDVYNLGATMYRMVTLRLPPSAIGDGIPVNEKTWPKLLKPVRDLAADCPADLARLIEECLQYSPMKRPERAADVQERLKELVDKLAPSPDDRLDAME